MSVIEKDTIAFECSLDVENILADFFLKKIEMKNSRSDYDEEYQRKSKHKKHKKSKHKQKTKSRSSTPTVTLINRKVDVERVLSSEEKDIKRLKKIKNIEARESKAGPFLPALHSSLNKTISENLPSLVTNTSHDVEVPYGPSLELLLTGSDVNETEFGTGLSPNHQVNEVSGKDLNPSLGGIISKVSEKHSEAQNPVNPNNKDLPDEKVESTLKNENAGITSKYSIKDLGPNTDVLEAKSKILETKYVEKHSHTSSRSRSKSKSRKISKSSKSKHRSRSSSVSISRGLGSRSKKRTYSRDRTHSKRRIRTRSKSRDKRRSRSKSRDKKGFRSKSRDKKISRSKSRDKRRSRSKSRDKRRSRSKSLDKRRSRSNSLDKRRSKSRDIRSRSKSRNKRRSKSKSREKRRSRSTSRDKGRSRSTSRVKGRSRSTSRVKGRSRSTIRISRSSMERSRSRHKRSKSKESWRRNKTRLSRSHSKSVKRTRSKSKESSKRSKRSSRSRSRSTKRSRSKSKESSKRIEKRSSRSRSKSTKRSRSKSKELNNRRNHSRSRSKSVKRSRSKSKESSKKRKKLSRSRSKSIKRSRSKSKETSNKDKHFSKSRSRSVKRSNSREFNDKSKKHSSRSRSRSVKRSKSKDFKSKRRSSRDRSKSASRFRERTRSRFYSRDRYKSKHTSRSKNSRYRSRSRSREYSNSRSRRESTPSSRSRSKKDSSPSYKSKRSRSKSKEKNSNSVKSNKIDQAKILQIAQKNVLTMIEKGTLPEGLSLDLFKKEQIVSLKSGGKSVQELTDFCTKLSERENESNEEVKPNAGNDSNNQDGDSDFIHHPFKLKEQPMIKLNIKNAVQIPIKTHAEKFAETAKLSSQFPVSSGNQHKQKELEWIPVVPDKNKAAQNATELKPVVTPASKPEVLTQETKKSETVIPSPISSTNTISYIPLPAQTVPALEPPPLPPLLPPPLPSPLLLATTTPLSNQTDLSSNIYSVPAPVSYPTPPSCNPFPLLPNDPVTPITDTGLTSIGSLEPVTTFKPTKHIDISSIVTMRFKALTKLKEDKNDASALQTMLEAQNSIQEWVASQQVPGLFTGSTDAKLLTVEELCGPKHWNYRVKKTLKCIHRL